MSHLSDRFDSDETALDECVTDMQCQDCGLELDAPEADDECDCLCHTFV
jgi:hypothetical protein